MEVLAKSDKKTLKDNMAPYFTTDIKEFVKEPYSKVDERNAEKWTEVISIVKTAKPNILTNGNES